MSDIVNLSIWSTLFIRILFRSGCFFFCIISVIIWCLLKLFQHCISHRSEVCTTYFGGYFKNLESSCDFFTDEVLKENSPLEPCITRLFRWVIIERWKGEGQELNFGGPFSVQLTFPLNLVRRIVILDPPSPYRFMIVLFFQKLSLKDPCR